MGFCLLPKILAKILVKLSSKYSQKLLGHAKQSAADVPKTASKKVIQKTAESVGVTIDNKPLQNNSETGEIEIERPRERYIFPEKKINIRI